MKLNTRGIVALTSVVRLAELTANKDTAVPLSEICVEADISLSYLEQIFAGLRRANVVRSYRGPGGGYVLARDADRITVAEIIDAAEDSIPARRINAKSRDLPDGLATMLGDIERTLRARFKNITLNDVMVRGKEAARKAVAA